MVIVGPPVKEGYASGHAYSTPYVLQATFLADKKIMFVL
jgi:hypothetical protein